MFTCPMHPEVQSEQPGMCPVCGMSLVRAKSNKGSQQLAKPHSAHANHAPRAGSAGAGKHAGHHTNVFATKFWVSLVLTIPIVLYSPLPQALLGWTPPTFTGAWLVPPLLGSLVFWYGGWVFLASAWRELRGRAPGMMTLISLAIVTAYTYSIAQVLRGETETLFWELTTLIVVMLLGHWIEMRAVTGAQGALKELSKLLPDTAEREVGETTETVSLAQLKVGDVIVVRPGGSVAADGDVIEGTSDINESLATGESKPVQKKVGDAVIAGTINGDGSLRVKVTKIGDETFLAGVMRLVRDAQASKSRLQLLSDRAAFYLTIIAVVAGLAAFIAWASLTRDVDMAVTRLVAVLVIACPHALGLAIPLVASISTTMAARNGLLVRERLSLEAARNVNVVLFDKTGTLTTGEYGVTGVYPVSGQTEAEVLRFAAAVDSKAEHAVARAIVRHAHQQHLDLPGVTDFSALPGKGVRGVIAGEEILVGGQAIVPETELSQVNQLQQAAHRGDAADTLIYVLREKTVIGMITLGDRIREESRAAVAKLKAQGVHVAMITGDAKPVATWVANELDIDTYFAEVLPEHKADQVKTLQQQGKRVAMVGDGINDAPALTQADVGIAVGAGTNVAIESAGIVLVKNDPRDIPKIIALSRLTYRKMIQNLFWATGYNLVALPLAAGIAAPWGIVLNPAVSAIFMSLSTVIVAINAVLLRRQSLA